MKKLLFGILLAGVAVSCIGSSAIKGSGKAASGTFSVDPNYTELAVSGGIHVILDPTLGGEGRVVADDMILDYVSITEKDGKVVVKYDPHISVNSKVQTTVTLPQSRAIASLKASSAASIKADTRILANSLNVESSSAANINIRVEARDLRIDAGSAADCYVEGVCEGECNISASSAATVKGKLSTRELYADLSSSASLKIEGTADYCNAKTSSSADFYGYDFVCRKVDADASSAGSVKVTATDELGASASSAGSIKYKGSPRLTSNSVSSGGSLKKID